MYFPISQNSYVEYFLSLNKNTSFWKGRDRLTSPRFLTRDPQHTHGNRVWVKNSKDGQAHSVACTSAYFNTFLSVTAVGSRMSLMRSPEARNFWVGRWCQLYLWTSVFFQPCTPKASTDWLVWMVYYLWLAISGVQEGCVLFEIALPPPPQACLDEVMIEFYLTQ